RPGRWGRPAGGGGGGGAPAARGARRGGGRGGGGGGGGAGGGRGGEGRGGGGVGGGGGGCARGGRGGPGAGAAGFARSRRVRVRGEVFRKSAGGPGKGPGHVAKRPFPFFGTLIHGRPWDHFSLGQPLTAVEHHNPVLDSPCVFGHSAPRRATVECALRRAPP